MLLRTDPDMTVTPLAQLTQLLHLCVTVLDIVFLWKAGRVIYPHVTAQTEEDARCFVSQKTGKRSVNGSIELAACRILR